MSRQRGFGVLFGLAALFALTLAAWFSPSSGISLGPVDGWIAGIPGIEDDLQAETEDRLVALGVRDAQVTVDGRDVMVELPSGFPSDLDSADLSSELLRTSGVRTVGFDAAVPQASLPTPAAAPEPTPASEPTPEPVAPVSSPNDIVARVDLGSVLLSGDLQTEDQRGFVLAELNSVPDLNVVDEMVVLDVASTDESDAYVQTAALATATLAREFASGSVLLNDDVLTVEGLVADEATATSMTDSIGEASRAAFMQSVVRITVAEADVEEVVSGLDLSGVNFESSTAQLRPDAFVILDEVAATLAGVTDVQIEVQGHTDDQGGADVNQALSEARAAVVAEYLETNGVDASILTVKGYGEAQPIDDNQTEQGRAANRRVELVVIEGN